MTAQQLKNSILQMAVQGKLVPQDPNDEPASVLIQKIREEKEQLINDGKIKKEKNPSFIYRGDDGLFYEKVGNKEPVCIEQEVPFEIPDSWEWVRLSTICTKLVDGDHNPPKGETKETAYIMASSKNINNDTLVELSNVRYLSESVFNKENERTDVKKGDIFFTSVGSLGRSCVYIGGKYICFQRSVSVITTLIYNYYLKYYFDSGYIQHKIVTEATGTAQKGFYLNQLGELLISVPPIREQHRIVEKIREILPYIDDCKKKEERLSLLNETFPEQLKKSILQRAVQGELVPQDPNDEPASVLIERIHDEKEQLIKDGEIKRDKHESVIYRRDGSYYEKVDGKERCIDDKIPFDIPESWEWITLKQIATSELGKTLNKAKDTGEYHPYLCSINIYWTGIDLTTIKQARFNDFELKKYKLKKGDLLVCEGGDIGRSAVWNHDEEMYYQNALHRIRFYAEISSEFFQLVLEFYKGNGILDKYSKGETIKHLVQKSLNSIYFPLPPIQEQHRIVDKVNQVLQIINNVYK